ncbi:cytochrome P450 [Streptomyces sp. STR69]|uniref:cytochrome P450 n=1 Tax=Streptomyces sp. STR69 TaxID=1796942 RepID=UPI0021C79756|nr:cytochrome P450 [Streptomyces sp. STR69]
MTETLPELTGTGPRVLPYDPFDPAFHSDPYAVYRTLRETSGNVIPTEAGYAVLGHRELSAVLRDPRFGRGDGAGVQDTYIPTSEGQSRVVMFMDPPDHTRLRSLINKAFTPRMVEAVRPLAEKFAADLLDRLRRESGGAPVDLVAEYFRPLGAYVLNVLVGVPEKYLARCIEYGNDAGRGLDPNYTLSPAELDARIAAREGYVEISLELIAARRAKPENDLMSQLVAVEQDGDRLTEVEVLTTAANIFLAGFSAPQAMMGVSALALFRHPEQLAWFRDNPEHTARSVEELMRYDSAVQLINRTVLDDAEIGDTQVKAGDEVFMVLGAANRDPEAYDRPEELDLTRPSVRHLGFGHGIHFCVAAPIARLVTQVALTTLFRHEVDAVTLTPPTNGAVAVRSLAELPVVLGPTR